MTPLLRSYSLFWQSFFAFHAVFPMFALESTESYTGVHYLLLADDRKVSRSVIVNT